jgi:hypothetical protein
MHDIDTIPPRDPETLAACRRAGAALRAIGETAIDAESYTAIYHRWIGIHHSLRGSRAHEAATAYLRLADDIDRQYRAIVAR